MVKKSNGVWQTDRIAKRCNLEFLQKIRAIITVYMRLKTFSAGYNALVLILYRTQSSGRYENLPVVQCRHIRKIR